MASYYSMNLTTARKVSKYGVFSGPYFPALGLNTERYSVFSPSTGKCGPEKTPYLDTFHAVDDSQISIVALKCWQTSKITPT